MTDDTQKPTETQPAPNISTEHQDRGDARRPGDTLDRDRPDADRPDADLPDPDEAARRSSL